MDQDEETVNFSEVRIFAVNIIMFLNNLGQLHRMLVLLGYTREYQNNIMTRQFWTRVKQLSTRQGIKIKGREPVIAAPLALVQI